MTKYLRKLICAFVGHIEEPVTLRLGKISQEKVKATKCKRCHTIRVPTSQFTDHESQNAE